MTVEYVLLLVAAFFIAVKGFTTAPAKAFKESAPRLGARVEKQMTTGNGFKPQGTSVEWSGP